MPSRYTYNNSIQFARKMDREDNLRSFRRQFIIPKIKGKPSIYLIGNSLGLQPKLTKQFILEELEDWAILGAEGHAHARRPWVNYHKFAKKTLAKLVGAKPIEVVAMNQLTVNLHLLMISFYKPTRERFKIITEAGAFSSDQYAFESQIKFHGLNPDQALIELKPREGEFTLRTEDIVRSIKQHADELALVIFGGVQYYTGQFFNLPEITRAGKNAGAMVGFDLAHAIGNTVLNLHKDDVDFAVWCSYKYLNSGPGSIAGAFVHEKHATNFELPRLTGWWGHNEQERFKMLKGFKPIAGVDGWQLSNPPVFQGAAHLASLQLFEAAGIRPLREKSIRLTGYLEFLLNEMDREQKHFKIITPENPEERGCQLSLYLFENGKNIFSKLIKQGVIADWREPNVIRVAPTPFYNTYEEVFLFAEIFKKALK
jgi:kynureninase